MPFYLRCLKILIRFFVEAVHEVPPCDDDVVDTTFGFDSGNVLGRPAVPRISE